MRRLATRSRVRSALVAGAAALGVALTTGAPASAWTADVVANVDVTTTIKKLNQTTTYPRGSFVGVLDSDKRTIVGMLSSPAGTTRLKIGSLPLADVTTKITQVGPSTTSISVDDWDWVLRTTQTTTVQIVSIKPVGLNLNLVGNYCKTAPFTQTLDGRFHTTGTGPGTSYDYWMTGTYTLPRFANCGLATPIINLAIPGAGNTVKAHFTR
jgi:hypothetical protein